MMEQARILALQSSDEDEIGEIKAPTLEEVFRPPTKHQRRERLMKWLEVQAETLTSEMKEETKEEIKASASSPAKPVPVT